MSNNNLISTYFYEPQISANTVLEIKEGYKHPETATERLARERAEKRRARAIKNGRRFI